MLAVFATGLAAPVADAATPSRKKSIWGPVERKGKSQFPIYRDLGAGILQMGLNWSAVAPTRPINPKNPDDPAYSWPAEIDRAVAAARRNRMKVSLLVTQAPPWANGGRDSRWAPRKPRDFAHFVKAAERRWPRVNHWMIWGEPSRREMFKPLRHERRGKPLRGKEKKGPRKYAAILDAAYGALKRESKRNRVIGGNTFTTGDVSPRNFIKNMRFGKKDRRPRLDLYGHNPFTARKPDLSKPPLGHGFADFSDLDTLARWVDRHLGRRGNRHPKLFLSEWFLPTDHPNHEFNFYVKRKTAKQWLRAALRITRRKKRIYTLGWYALYDDPRRADGQQVERGLLTRKGRKKPAYRAFKRG